MRTWRVLFWCLFYEGTTIYVTKPPSFCYYNVCPAGGIGIFKCWRLLLWIPDFFARKRTNFFFSLKVNEQWLSCQTDRSTRNSPNRILLEDKRETKFLACFTKKGKFRLSLWDVSRFAGKTPVAMSAQAITHNRLLSSSGLVGDDFEAKFRSKVAGDEFKRSLCGSWLICWLETSKLQGF